MSTLQNLLQKSDSYKEKKASARLLMNLILVNSGYGVVSIPPAWKNEYIDALSASRRESDMDPFSRLIAECVIEAELEYCRLLQL